MVTPSMLPQCNIIWAGGAGGPWCTGNAVYVEDPIWDIACIVYNSTRLAQGLILGPQRQHTHFTQTHITPQQSSPTNMTNHF